VDTIYVEWEYFAAGKWNQGSTQFWAHKGNHEARSLFNALQLYAEASDNTKVRNVQLLRESKVKEPIS
jgi:hypothetical protein